MQEGYKVLNFMYPNLFESEFMFNRIAYYLRSIHFDDYFTLWNKLDIRIVHDTDNPDYKYPLEDINNYRDKWIQINGEVKDNHFYISQYELITTILTWYIMHSSNNTLFARIYKFYYKFKRQDNYKLTKADYILPDKYHTIISNILNALGMNLETYVEKKVRYLMSTTTIYDNKK